MADHVLLLFTKEKEGATPIKANPPYTLMITRRKTRSDSGNRIACNGRMKSGSWSYNTKEVMDESSARLKQVELQD